MAVQKYKTVSEFLAGLDSAKRAQIELLREIIQSSHEGLTEHIKWNAPSYVLDGEDRITFNLMNKEGVVKVVIHMGALRKEDKKAAPVMLDESGLIEWSSDIRGIVAFNSIEQIKEREEDIRSIFTRWLAIA